MRTISLSKNEGKGGMPIIAAPDTISTKDFSGLLVKKPKNKPILLEGVSMKRMAQGKRNIRNIHKLNLTWKEIISSLANTNKKPMRCEVLKARREK